MQTRTLWPDDPVFIEIGANDADLANGLRQDGYHKYLGVCSSSRQADDLRAQHPQLADQLTSSTRRKLVLNNNAEVLVLSGRWMSYVWSYRSVRHARWVAWPLSLNPLSLVALAGCLWHLLNKRYSWPRVVSFRGAGGATKRLLVARVRRQKLCRRSCLHFIPHAPGLTGMFRELDQRGVRYAVLRWFEKLPEIEPSEDVDLLVEDDSIEQVIESLASLPGIQPCDLYSPSGLARSAYCGTPYYPYSVAQRILDGAVRHNDVCRVPNPWDYFHSLAYHAVYHKGTKSNLSRGNTKLTEKTKSSHDFTGILGRMAANLSIEVENSLEGLHRYLQETGWGPPPEMLARLAVADRRSEWLQLLARQLPVHVNDQGLAVFVLRQEAVRGGFQQQIVEMVGQNGFEVLAVRTLADDEVAHVAARTRGGNWIEEGPFDRPGGDPAATVIAYDHQPIPPSRKQRRRFPNRTNARLFAKESIRDAIVAQLPRGESFNALHSSDHAAEAWHLIEVLAPDLLDTVRTQVAQMHAQAEPDKMLRAA
jgi:hypothetical protein